MGICKSREPAPNTQVIPQGNGQTIVTGTNKQLGRLEIWQTLKLVCEAYGESKETAQAIIDSANITVPTGRLTDGCYDELGNQYKIEPFCLCNPTNLLEIVPSVVEKVEKIETSPELPDQFNLTMRLSTGKDIKIDTKPTEEISILKQKLIDKEPGIKDARIRIMVLGKILEDHLFVGQTKISPKTVVQVLIQQF
ncbi:hypothetical protein EDD86DRAFT_256617 [Gorgonomyces haynaldii]|nr:hypothetical protein EDD86DRAFT_256617 [Gorgonomyces haynaldii]